jgi:Kef-type K+ transport system membrane component KefB
MMTVIVILALAGLMHAARSFATHGIASSAGTAISFGYLLLTGFYVGSLFNRLRLPRLTGYLAAGIAVGPSVLGLVPQTAIDSLTIFTGVAIALIALTAGTELELKALGPLLRSIAWLSGVAICGTALLIAAAVFFLSSLLPFMNVMAIDERVAVCIVLGVVMVAQSPAVVVALRKEMEAHGPVTQTVLAIVVVGDLLVILLFALASTLAKATFGAATNGTDTVRALAWELVGSLVAGLLIGAILATYLRKVKASGGLFVLATCFVVAEVGRRLEFDPLLVALSAGVFVRNVTGVGARLHEEIENSSLPVYIIFFTIAGATIHLDVLAVVGVPAVVLVVVRAAGLLTGSRIAGRLARAPETVRRYAGFGLLPQAGLALALALLFSKTFPEFGADASALTLGVVAINELAAPALYRFALVKSGEAGWIPPRA